MTSEAENATPDSAQPPSAEKSFAGQLIHKYEIVRVIGRGGMGTVYEALNTAISKRVAMKFVDAEMARNKDAVARFQREAQAASAVESAHIVEIFDSGETDDGIPFIVMELLRGEDLGHRIKRCGRLDMPEAAHVTAQILRGLHRAHEAGIVHRDLKPDNIFLVDRDDDPNFAKILDFGISKVQRVGQVPVSTLTRQGTVLGTPFYMSPEQAQALSDIDGRTDLWSVGAILYECLSGRPPYSGVTYEQVIINICMKDAEDIRMHNPAVSEAVAQLIARALTRDRDARFATAREFLDALGTATGGLVSSRRSSGDELMGAMSPVPRQVSSRPEPRVSASTAFDPTLEMLPAGTSKVGWSTSSGKMAQQNRRRYLLVGGVALAVGAAAGLAFVRAQPPAVAGTTSTTQIVTAAPPSDVTMRLSVVGSRAKFTVDGLEMKDGVLRGKNGEKRHVLVEAEGASPFYTDVQLTPATPALALPLPPSAPTPSVQVSPTGEPSAAATASAEPKHAPRHVNAGVHPPKPPPITTPPPKSGVGGSLTIKND